MAIDEPRRDAGGEHPDHRGEHRESAPDPVAAAIKDARSAADAIGLSPTGLGEADDGTDRPAKVAYAFELTGLGSPADVGEIERALEEIPGVRARIIHPSATAYITAPDTVTLRTVTEVLGRHGVTAMLTETSLRRRVFTYRSPATKKSPAGKNMSWAARRHVEEEAQSLRKLRDSGFLDDAGKREVVDQDAETDVLYTARALIRPLRLFVALAFTLPVLVLSYATGIQFDGWQWVALALSVPVVTWCAWPFHRALAGGVRRGLTALDGASALAIIVAFVWSVVALLFTDAGEIGWSSRPSWFAFEQRMLVDGELFLDVACVMTVVLLAGRLATMRSRVSLLEHMESRRPDSSRLVLVARSRRPGVQHATATRPDKVPLGEVNVGDDVVVNAGEVIPVDGHIIGGSCRISPGVVAADEVDGAEVKVGDYVHAGTKNRDGRIKVRVERTGHRTRMAAIHRWVEEANRRQNRATMLSTKSASFLIPLALAIAVVDFFAWYLLSGNLNAAVATALAVLASVAPVALALSPSLAIRHGIEAAARNGIMVRDGATVRELDNVDTVVFNRLGTLTTNDMSVENVVAESGEHPELILRVAAALMVESDHPASRAVVRAARASRDRDSGGGDGAFPHWIEAARTSVTEDGSFIGSVELPVADEGKEPATKTVEAVLWRPRTMSDVSGRIAAAVVAGGTPFVVRWQGRDRGVITLLDMVRDDAADAIEYIEDLGVETIMISRDAYPVSRRFADRIGIDQVLAGIAPGDKAKTVRSVHTRGGTVAMVGDGSVLPTMTTADIGILMGETQSLDGNPHGDARGIRVIVLPQRVTAIGQLIAHSRRICRIIDRNIIFSWAYNILAMAAAVSGILNPMVATLLMVGSSAVIEARSNSAQNFPKAYRA